MQQSYWLKSLSDGSKEVGNDSQIARKKASWTKGRQDIVSATISLNDSVIEVVSERPSPHIIPKWRQLDNFSFSAAAGKSFRNSRELWCSTDFFTRLNTKVFSNGVYKTTKFFLNNHSGESIPNDVSWLVCRIGIDGRVDHRWS